MPEALREQTHAGPHSDLEVVGVEHIRADNLHSRSSLVPRYSDQDGLHPYHREVGSRADDNGLMIVNERNLQPFPAASEVDLKKEQANSRWTSLRRRKAIRLTVLVVIIAIIAIIGGSIGGVVGSRKGSHSSSSPPSTSGNATNTTAAGLPISTGTYQLSVNRTVQNETCISQQQFADAWACLNVSTWNVTFPTKSRIVFPQEQLDTNLTYGPQLPAFKELDFTLTPVIDKQDPQKGTAMFFSTSFDKLVILPQDAVSSPPTDVPTNQTLPVNQTLAPGDTLYFCRWNGTILDFYTYPSDPGYNNPLTYPSDPGSIPLFPGTTKIIERRVEGSGRIQPYCELRDVLDDGRLQIIAATDLMIEEGDPGCGCEWRKG